MKLKKILITSNTSWYLFNFRLGLIEELINEKNEIYIVAPEDKYSLKLIKIGCNFISINFDNKGLNPFKDYISYFNLKKIYNRIKPNLILNYTIKPVIFGSLAAKKLSIPYINNITGLGTVFITRNWVTFFVKFLYKLVLKYSNYIFFQNFDDYDLFKKYNLISKSTPIDIIPGTGINLEKFEFSSYPKSKNIIFLYIGRIIKDKGFLEFIEVAKKIIKSRNDIKFQVLGYLNVKNRTAITKNQLEYFINQGYIEYLGNSDDVRPFIKKASCIVLPSYREGLPKSLLEAASMGRPIISTNVTGCREIVFEGKNGFLCNPRDSKDLYHKTIEFITLSYNDKKKLGINGRKIMKKSFDEKKIIQKIISHINEILI